MPSKKQEIVLRVDSPRDGFRYRSTHATLEDALEAAADPIRRGAAVRVWRVDKVSGLQSTIWTNDLHAWAKCGVDLAAGGRKW